MIFTRYMPSLNNPREDPFVLWLTGGPGCSSMLASVIELGPCFVQRKGQDGGKDRPNPFGWNARANLIFLDQPVGTGFSTVDGAEFSSTSDIAARHVWQFMKTFFSEEFSRDAVQRYGNNVHHVRTNQEFYVTGESYAG